MSESQENNVVQENNVAKEKVGLKRKLKNIGPGLILAAATIGPGSVVTASVNGAKFGYTLIWVVIVAVIIRTLYSRAFYGSSLVLKMPTIEAIRKLYGSKLAILTGITCIMGSIAFQIGNFAGTGTGAELLLPVIPWKYWGLIMTVIAIWLIYSKNVYNLIEMVMKVIVAVMVVTFAVTLFAAGGPSAVGMAQGVLPIIPEGSLVTVLALVSSTISITGMAYGTYLGREKKWTTDDITNGTIKWDIGVSVASIGLITLMIMLTGAVVLNPQGITIANISDLINAVIPIIGWAGKYLLGVGFFGAAVSSMIVNSQVGSTLLLSSLGKSAHMNSKEARLLSTGILLFGCAIGFIVGKTPANLLIAANACTIINAPLLGLFGILLATRKEMGQYKMGKASIITLIVCYVAILMITGSNIIKLLASLGV